MANSEYSITESSISNTVSKDSVNEEMSLSLASLEDAAGFSANGRKPETIANEKILKGDELLETYRVSSDAVHGGMGSVWRVHHKSWNIDLAMKRPQPKFFAEGSARRKAEFIAECENWINLGLHPNIVSCYYVRDVSGVPSVFSEWMDGGSLKDRIRDGSLYEGTETEVQKRILDIAIQTARGLQYSHDKQLIHQDVKPGNILLSTDWAAKAADFGLAKAQSRLSDDGQLLSSGYTREYCPKEQAEGAPAEPWMDVYAWVLTVLEMYAGSRFWSDGASAFTMFFGGREPSLPACRVAVPARLFAAFRDDYKAGRGGWRTFSAYEQLLREIFQDFFGHEYPRPEWKETTDTSDILNNRALSFLDLGKDAQADHLLDEALAVNPNNIRAFYNRNLFDWRHARISDEMAVQHVQAKQKQLALTAGDSDTFSKMLADLNTERNDEWIQSGKNCIMESEHHCFAEYGAFPEQLFVNNNYRTKVINRPKPVYYTEMCTYSPLNYFSAVSVAGDGRKYAIAGLEGIVEVYSIDDNNEDSPVLLWHAAQKEEARAAEIILDSRRWGFLFQNRIAGLAFSEDGRWLFSSGWKTDSVLWNADDGSRVAVFPSGYAACFNHACSRLAITGHSGSRSVEIYELPSLKRVEVYSDLPNVVRAVRYINHDTELLISCYGGAVVRIGRERSAPVICAPLETKVPGKYLMGGYAGSSQGMVFNYPEVDGNTVIAFTPDGKLGLTVGGNLCDLYTGKCIYTYNTSNKPSLSPDGKKVFTSMPSENSTYKFWHLNIIEGCEWPVPEEWEPKAHWMLSRIADYQETADRERRLTELIEKCCRELEKGDDQAILSALDEIRTIPGADEKPEYEQLCRRIAGILPISGARSIRTVSMKNEEFKNQLIKEANDKCYILESSAGLLKKKYQIVSKEPGDAAKDTYYRVTMSQDRKYGLSSRLGRKDQVIVWDLEKRSKICKLTGFQHRSDGGSDIYRMCFSPDNQYVAASSYRQLLVWDLKSRKIVKTITEECWKTRLVFSHDNRLFAYCPGDYSPRFRVINIPCKGKEQGTDTDILFECAGECKALSFSRDGRRIWSLDNSAQNGLKLWDLSNPKEPLMMATSESSFFNKLRLEENETVLYVLDGVNYDADDAACFHVDYEFKTGKNEQE